MLTKQTILLYSLCLAGLCSVSGQSAKAQCQAEAQSQEVVRTTSDTVRIYGWEKALTQRDPSLAKWDWEPITNTMRGHGAPTWGVAVPKAGSHYVKMNHADAPVADEASHSSNGYNHAAVMGVIRSKPHIPTPTATTATTATYATVKPGHDKCPPRAPVMATYSTYSHGASHNSTQIARSEVLGQLVSR
jgi:hypothetical protein